jgi:hypothetical protein
MTAPQNAVLHALRTAAGLSPDGWVEAWEIEPFLPIELYVTDDRPYWSDACRETRYGGMPRRFGGVFTAWRWPEGQSVTCSLTWLRRRGLAESCPLLRATRTGNLAYVGRRAWKPVAR